jgi:hypothetical protein
MHDSLLEELFNVPFILKQRPLAISPDLRIVRRLALLVIILDHCRGARANIEQLHVLNWAVRNEHTREAFLAFLSGTRSPDRAIVSYDPSLSRLIAFALAERFVERNEQPIQQQLPGLEPQKPLTYSTRGIDYRIKLSTKGMALVAALSKDKDTLVTEWAFLKRVGNKVTKQKIHDLLFWGLK